jgi:hypothetical protein
VLALLLAAGADPTLRTPKCPAKPALGGKVRARRAHRGKRAPRTSP